MGILRPVADRDLDILDDNVDKPGFFHPLPLQIILDNTERPPRLFTTRPKYLGELIQGAVLGDALVRDPDKRGVLVLDPAAGLASTEGFPVQPRPVGNVAGQEADVDEVKGVVVPGPIEVGVVDLELDVRRYPARLDGRQVGARYFDTGMSIAKVTVGNVSSDSVRVGRAHYIAHNPVPVPTSRTF